MFKNLIKHSFVATAIVLAALIILNIHLIPYLFDQAKGQVEVLWNAIPIEEAVHDPLLPDSLKDRLNWVTESKAFAEKIGLEVNKSYTTLYNQQGKTTLWNLSACEPYSFTPYQWKFPIVGQVPYKGFFDLDKALSEKEILDGKGYDTRIRSVSAWSTLGWFNDPIMSNLLFRSKGSLVETIFHEITHQNIFIKDSIDFNENLASFIGVKAAELFLEEKFCSNSSALIEYRQEIEDERKFIDHILRGKEKLQSLYKNLDERQSATEKTEKKNYLIREVIENLDTISFHDPSYYSLFKGKTLPNNAYFMSFSRYHSQSEDLDSLYIHLDRDLNSFIRFFKRSQN
jgi:predicted aminopeptidase